MIKPDLIDEFNYEGDVISVDGMTFKINQKYRIYSGNKFM